MGGPGERKAPAQRHADALVAKLRFAAATGSMVTLTSIEARVLVTVMDEWKAMKGAFGPRGESER